MSGLTLVVVIRKDLKMRIGKIVAQSIHAATGACEKSLGEQQTQIWMREHFERKALCLKAYGENQMNELVERAKKLGLNWHMQIDAGLTQVAPNTFTVLAVGPHTDDELQEFKGDLKLF